MLNYNFFQGERDLSHAFLQIKEMQTPFMVADIETYQLRSSKTRGIALTSPASQEDSGLAHSLLNYRHSSYKFTK